MQKTGSAILIIQDSWKISCKSTDSSEDNCRRLSHRSQQTLRQAKKLPRCLGGNSIVSTLQLLVKSRGPLLCIQVQILCRVPSTPNRLWCTISRGNSRLLARPKTWTTDRITAVNASYSLSEGSLVSFLVASNNEHRESPYLKNTRLVPTLCRHPNATTIFPTPQRHYHAHIHVSNGKLFLHPRREVWQGIN